MKEIKDKTKVSLSRRIFQYLISTTLITIILLGSFWVKDNINKSRKEIVELKRSFSENRKSEIKNKILQIKDYIYWVRFNPIFPISKVMDERFKEFDNNKASDNFSIDKFKMSIDKTKDQLPGTIYLFDHSYNIVYSHNSKINAGSEFPPIKAKFYARNKHSFSSTELIHIYAHKSSKDSILEWLIFCNNKLKPDYSIVAAIHYSDFDNFLKQFILDSLSRLRFAKDEYIFINTLKGKALVSNGKLNSTPIDILNSGNKPWISVFKIQQRSANMPGGLFYTYNWQKISSSQFSRKTSYFSYMPEWQWIIGTGFYEDDVESLILLKREALFNSMKDNLIKVTSFLLFLILMTYLIVYYFSKRLGKNIEVFNTFFNNAANSGVLIDNSNVSYKEFMNIAESANRMVLEQENSKSALQKSEEKFFKAFKNSPDAITITTKIEGYIIDANESTARITGYSLDEIIGHSVIDLNFWKNTEVRQQYISLINRFGRVLNFEADLRMKSGEVRNGLFSGEIIKLGNKEYILSVIRDITDRKRDENNLRESEEKYRYLFEQNPAPILIYELGSLNILDINEAFINHYGYSKDEIVTMHLTDLYPENEKEAISNLTKKLTGLTYVGVWHHIKKDGTMITIEVNSHGFSFEGHPSRIAVISDITARKQAEEALLKNEELYRTIFENTGTATVMIDEDTIISLANAEFEKLSKYTKLEIEGKKSWTEFVLKEDLERMKIQHDLRRGKKGTALKQYEFRFVTRESDIRNILLTIDLIPETKKSVASLLDITDRKHTELRLHKLNRIYALLSEINQTIMKVHKPQELFELACNIAVEKGGFLMAWIGLLDPETKRVNHVAHAGKINDYLEKLDIRLDDSELGRGPTATALKSGQHIVVNNIDGNPQMLPWREHALALGYRASAAFPISVLGELRGTLNLYAAEPYFFDEEEMILLDKLAANIAFALEFDVEEEQRKKAEEGIQLLNTELEQRVVQRTVQLESINKELESFSYSISHDLRAPLRAIFGFSQILSRRHRESLNEEGRQYMDYIVEASVRMEQLINDLLNYSRLGRKSLNIHSVSLQTILNNIYSDFDHQLKEIDAELIIDNKLPQINGDETLLRQIFTNLIGNCITYRRKEVPLMINIGCEAEEKNYIIKISDNGIGIPQEYWEKIFNVFQRLHSEEQYPGTGIGLANVKKSVSLLGGIVWVESVVNEGSTFYIKLPQQNL